MPHWISVRTRAIQLCRKVSATALAAGPLLPRGLRPAPSGGPEPAALAGQARRAEVVAVVDREGKALTFPVFPGTFLRVATMVVNVPHAVEFVDN